MTARRSAEWKQLCGRVHARAKHLGLDADTRRDFQRRTVGKESCADMTAAELRRVLAAMRGPAAPARRGGRRSRNDDELSRRLAGKLAALWISGWHLGVVRDRTDAGLAAWFRRQTGLDAVQWAKTDQIVRAVDALQAWLARDGGVDWSAYPVQDAKGKTRMSERPQARVLEAQWRRLHELGVVRVASDSALGAYAAEHAGLGRADSHLALSPAETVALMQDLGVRIRRARDEGGR